MDEYIFGLRPLEEYLKEGKMPEKVLIQQGLSGELFQKLFGRIRELKIPFQMVPVEKLNKITRNNHQGIIAFVSVIEYQNLGNLLTLAYENGEIPLVIILDKVTDIRNLGAVARTAEVCGAHAIVIGEKASAPVNSDAIKTSAGALARIPVCREKDLWETMTFLKESGLKIIATSEKASQSVFGADLEGPVAIVMGSEDKGISRNLLALADETIAIPQKGKTGSLNVSVAAGVVLFEAIRQRHYK